MYAALTEQRKISVPMVVEVLEKNGLSMVIFKARANGRNLSTIVRNGFSVRRYGGTVRVFYQAYQGLYSETGLTERLCRAQQILCSSGIACSVVGQGLGRSLEAHGFQF